MDGEGVLVLHPTPTLTTDLLKGLAQGGTGNASLSGGLILDLTLLAVGLELSV